MLIQPNYGSTLLAILLLRGKLWTPCPRLPMNLILEFSMKQWVIFLPLWTGAYVRALRMFQGVRNFMWLSWEWRGMPRTWLKLATSTELTTLRRKEVRSVDHPKGHAPTALQELESFQEKRLRLQTRSGCLQWVWNLPWVQCPAVIKNLVHDCGDPAAFFKSDIWHVVHLGFGRSWVASTVQLVLQHLPCSNLEEKWEYLTEDYLRWCQWQQETGTHQQDHSLPHELWTSWWCNGKLA